MLVLLQVLSCTACTLARERPYFETRSGKLRVACALALLSALWGRPTGCQLLLLYCCRRARLVAPSIIFLDELDSLVGELCCSAFQANEDATARSA